MDEAPPFPHEQVMVVTDTFRCLGYRDNKGVWRHQIEGMEIENVRGWYPSDLR